MSASGSDNLFASSDGEPVVSALVPLPSDPNILSVRVGRRAVARLRSVDADAIGLEVGAAWTESLAERIDRVRALDKVRRAALRLLGRRPYSKAELAERLARNETDEVLVADVIDELEAGGWIDDVAYARQIAETVSRQRPAGEALLLERIRRRGIDEATARAVVADHIGDVDPVEVAEAFARRRLSRMGAADSAAAARRLAGMLARRGYDSDTVTSVIQRLGLLKDVESD